MMKFGAVVGMLALIMGLILIFLGLAYLYNPPPPPQPSRPPIAELDVRENNDGINITIKSLSFKVPLDDIFMKIYHRTSTNISGQYLNEITYFQSGGNTNNVTYYDIDKDNKFSKGDYFILKTDWDGPELYGNADGNFTNDGPLKEGDDIILIDDERGGTICDVTIKI